MATELKINHHVLLSIIVVLNILLSSCLMNRDNNDSQVKASAFIIQPKFEVVGEPTITQINFSDSSRNRLKEMESYDSLLDTIDVKENTILKIVTNLEVTNFGNSSGTLLLYITTDTLSEVNELRGFLCGDQNYLQLNYQVNFFSTELKNQLLPLGKDSLYLEFIHTIQFNSDKKFTLHYLLIYEDENGNIFDTYFVSEYKFKNTINPQIFTFRDGDIFEKEYLGNNLSLTIQEYDVTYLKHSEPIYHSYQKERSNYIKKLIVEMNNKLSNRYAYD